MINVMVIYYSPTGGCRKLGQNVLHPTWNIESIDITYDKNQILSRDLSNIDILFVIVPVYAQSISKDILKALKQIKFSKNIVLCVGYGAVHSGRALAVLANIFKKSGGIIIGGGEFICEHSYASNSLKLGINRPDEKDIIMMKSLCDGIAEKIMNPPNKFTEINFPHKYNRFSLIFPKLMAKKAVKLPIADNKCINCGKCENVCPQRIIDDAGRIIDSKKCIRCLACYKNCPVNARKLSMNYFTFKYLKSSVKNDHKSKIYLS